MTSKNSLAIVEKHIYCTTGSENTIESRNNIIFWKPTCPLKIKFQRLLKYQEC